MKIIQKPSPHHYDLDGVPDVLVLHTTTSSMPSTINHFLNPSSQVSAHYGIPRKKSDPIVQFVSLNQGAWHAGRRNQPSPRARAVLPKHPWGAMKNPNKHSIGLEFVSGYDIDQDGVIENWEKLYTVEQMKMAARLVIDVIEPSVGTIYDNDHIIIHKDIAIDKPELEVQRSVFLEVLKAERGVSSIPTPQPKLVLDKNESATIRIVDGKVEITKA